jgi:hypothetical protein
LNLPHVLVGGNQTDRTLTRAFVAERSASPEKLILTRAGVFGYSIPINPSVPFGDRQHGRIATCLEESA